MLQQTDAISQVIAGLLDDVSTVAATEDEKAPVRITAQRALHVNLRLSDGSEVTAFGADPVGLKDSGGTPIDPSTETTLALALAAINAIKNTDGIKKITDALPAGTNKLGKVSVTNATGSDEADVGNASNWSSLPTGADVGRLNPNKIYQYVASLAHQLWPTSGNRAGVSGDGRYWGQLMNDLGDLVVSLGSVTTAAGSTQILAGEGASGNGSPRVTVAGQVAHDAADSGNPIKLGGKARNANPTAVANNDRADLFMDLVGRPVVTVGQARGLKARATITLTGTTETTLLAAGGAGVYHDLVVITAINTSSSAVRVDIRDTTGGSVVLSLYPPPGGSDGFVTAIPIDQASANTNWTAQLSSAVTDVRVFVHATKNVA